MPYPALDNVTQLKPIFVDTFDDFSKQLEEYLTKEHKSDGTHGAVTADSIEIAGNITVHGFSGFQDLSGNSMTVATLTVQNAETISPIEATQALTISPTTATAAAGMAFINTGGTLTLGINRSSGGPFGGGNYDASLTYTSTHDFMVLASGGSLNLLASGVVSIGGSGPKFTVDGATGNVGTAGILTASQSSGSLVRHSFLNTNAGHIQTDLNIGKGGGADVYVGVNYLGGTNAFIDNRSGGDLLFKDGGTTHVTFTSTGVTIEGTLRAKGAIQFDSLTSGFLKVDGSGNVSKDATVLVGNGVNFGPAAVASITVVGGQITNIS